MESTLPVLICGAGPTGLTLALELSRFDVPFRIVDRNDGPALHSRALAVQPRTLELLEACRVTERLLMFAQKIGGVEVRDGGRTLFALELAGMPTPYPFVAAVGQETTERTMIVCLHEQGAVVERGIALTSVEQDADGVTVQLAGPNGIERVRTRYLAACDGPHSTVRHSLDVPFAGHAVPGRFALADVRLETTLPHDRIAVMLDAMGGMFMLAPFADLWRAVIVASSGHGEPDAADVQRLIERHHLPARVTALEWSSDFKINQRKVAHYVVGRTFFLGDAAHVHSPVGGQGMNAGIGDAVNLAWKIALVVHDGVDPRILATYHDEREPVGRALLRATAMGNQLVFNRSGAARAVRNAVVPLAVQVPMLGRRVRENLAGLRIAYRNSPLSVNDPTARRGLRAGMRVRGHRPGGYRPQPLVVPEDETGTPMTVVVRPDGYAGYVADGAHAGGAHTYLRNVIGLS